MVVAAVLNVGASVMNGGAGGASVTFFHGFQVALMMCVMFNLTQFVYWKCKATRKGSCWQIHAPTVYTLIAAILTNVQPLAILVTSSWQLCCTTCENFGYPANCTATGRTFPAWGDGTFRPCNGGGNFFWDESYCLGKKLPIFPTQVAGWVIQVSCTWGGFVFMFFGIMQATQMHKKLGSRWRAIRRR